jgi:hypothetical protein
MNRIWVIVLAASVLRAAAQTNGPPRGWSPSFQGGSMYHFDAGLEGGGDVSQHRYYGEAGLGYLFRTDRLISFSVGYGQDDYDFNGTAAAPWNNIDNFRAGIFTRWAHSDRWASFVALSGRTYGEPDADLSESITGAVFGGASYRFSDRLKLGPGLGVVGQLEDNPRFFPIIVVDWNITEKLNLSTGGGLAATAGPGLELTYSLTRNWKFGLGGRYESKRFRLSDQGPSGGGVGEDRGIPVYGGIRYELYPGTYLSGLVGSTLGGRLQAENPNGVIVYRADYEEALFAGITLGLRL